MIGLGLSISFNLRQRSGLGLNADTRDTDKKTIEHGDGERCGLLYTGYRLTISFLVSLH